MRRAGYVIWSEEHGAWWRPGKAGYTRRLEEAGRYSVQEATQIEMEANEHPPGGLVWSEVAIKDPLLTHDRE
jgi:hypothetical protein